jgi:SAM-dependent methyltransferase
MIDMILSSMLLDPNNLSIQTLQTRHRLNLAQFWGIKPGEKILEIGCGQGDTTAVLAELVGDNGQVVALDIASGDYGSPYTLAQSLSSLTSSPLGRRINVHLETDFLSHAVQFPPKHFDKVILSHASWYFENRDVLARIIEKSRLIARQFCYAEWDTRVTEVSQMAHLYAVHIQNQYNLFAHHDDCNIRTLITNDDLSSLMSTQGVKPVAEQVFKQHQLQDGDWEVGHVLHHLQQVIANSKELNAKTKAFFHSQIAELQHYAASGVAPLNAHASVWDLGEH